MTRNTGRRRRALAALSALTCLGAAACGTATTAAVASTSPVTASPEAATPTTTPPPPSIPTGPGLLASYSVQSQPAPGTCHYRYLGVDPLPDPRCTPGAVNPQVTQADIATTICQPGWTATVRPPVSVTGPEKAGSALAYGYNGSFTTAEYDHLIPLELGGDPNDAANLWLEPNDDPGATSTHNDKDELENTLRKLVCSGSVTLSAARQAIATDWVAAARRYGG